MSPRALNPKLLHIIYNPRIANAGAEKLNQMLRWNDPDKLAAQYIENISFASYGLVQYQIVERIEIDGFPQKADGFIYTSESYLRCWRARLGFHQPDGVDYERILDEFNVIHKINQGEIDEVWLSAFPYAGFYESRMVGDKAFWCNAPPLITGKRAHRLFVIMGFNYERGVGEMLENLGHRAEAILSRLFADQRWSADLWERFTRYDLTHPGRAEVGNVHFAPNSERDYDWGNQRQVLSACDNWYRFPDLEGAPRLVNSRKWGNGDILKHHIWWFRHFPHVEGESNGVSHNWWEYVIDPNRV